MSEFNRNDLISVLKAQQWAKCKGELNALIELEGAKFPEYKGNTRVEPDEFNQLRDIITTFIVSIEDNGLDE